MSQMNTVRHTNGEILTGRLWRKSHTFFNDLSFYTDVPRTDDIGSFLEEELGEGSFEALLIVSSPFLPIIKQTNKFLSESRPGSRRNPSFL